jgi:hypothetical protein
VPEAVKMSRKNSQSSAFDRIPSEKHNNMGGCTEKRRDDGFLLSCDYFTIRRQSRKADANRLIISMARGWEKKPQDDMREV